MTSPDPHSYDVIILGNHPATYLAGILLRDQPQPLDVLHLPLAAASTPDRLLLINPEFFHLHPSLSELNRTLDLTPIYGVCFLAEEPQAQSEHRAKKAMACVGKLSEITREIRNLAKQAGVVLAPESRPLISPPDQSGITLQAGNQRLRTKAILVGDRLDPAATKALSLEQSWDREVLHQLSFLHLDRACPAKLGPKKSLPMSLDLKRSLDWAWFIPFGENAQPFVLHSAPQQQLPPELLRHWIAVLKQHDLISASTPAPEPADILSIEIALAGALTSEAVGDRTLAIGPAGGFYAATAEDLYPNCWSALFAVEVLVKALHQHHLQDALQDFRQNWRMTLGEYLRGPQQNLRFLLPLVYRNRVMTARLAESILHGKSVVRPDPSDNEEVR
jgi:hypothetical protein